MPGILRNGRENVRIILIDIGGAESWNTPFSLARVEVTRDRKGDASMRYEMTQSYFRLASRDIDLLLGCTIDPVLRERILSAFDSQIAYFERLVLDGQQHGEIDTTVVPRQAAEALFSFVEGKIMLAKLRDDAETLRDLLPEAERILGFSAE